MKKEELQKAIKIAVKELTSTANVEGFNNNDYENYEVDDLHYGAENALRELQKCMSD